MIAVAFNSHKGCLQPSKVVGNFGRSSNAWDEGHTFGTTFDEHFSDRVLGATGDNRSLSQANVNSYMGFRATWKL